MAETWKPYPKNVLGHWLTTVNEEAVGLTKWERDFMESITEQWDRTGSLSRKQQEILERIYADKTP